MDIHCTYGSFVVRHYSELTQATHSHWTLLYLRHNIVFSENSKNIESPIAGAMRHMKL